jgi:hypothetical protein
MNPALVEGMVDFKGLTMPEEEAGVALAFF